MDKLDISALCIATRVGVHDWEQRINQRLLIDVSITTDFTACNNKLENTIDYDRLCQRITNFVESHTFTLIETVAEEVTQLIKQEFNVKQLTVRVSKPDAIKNAANISVTIDR